MSRIIHLSLDIRGALCGSLGQLKDFVRDTETGRYLSPSEAQAWLTDCLAEGKRVLPLNDCPGFSFETGCPGHEEVQS